MSPSDSVEALLPQALAFAHHHDQFIGKGSDSWDDPLMLSFKSCISPTLLLDSINEQLDGVPVNPAEMAQGVSL